MPNLMPCPMPTCGAPIDAVHLVPQGMGAFTYAVRCDCGLSFDTGAQSEASAAERWNEQPAPAGGVDERAEFEAWHAATWPNGAPVKGRWEAWEARALLARPASEPKSAEERGSSHGFEQNPNSCRHDERSGVWWRERDVTRTGRECVACGSVEEDPVETRSTPAGVVLPSPRMIGPEHSKGPLVDAWRAGWNACLETVALFNGAPK